MEQNFERRTIAAVAYAELSELMTQIHHVANVIGILSNVIGKERIQELRRNVEVKPEVETDMQQRFEGFRAGVKVILELTKEFGSKSLLQAGPMSLGRLGPDLAYAVRSQYAQIESIMIEISSPFVVADIQILVEFLVGMENLGKRLYNLKNRWEQHVRPMLVKATGIRVSPLV